MYKKEESEQESFRPVGFGADAFIELSLPRENWFLLLIPYLLMTLWLRNAGEKALLGKTKENVGNEDRRENYSYRIT